MKFTTPRTLENHAGMYSNERRLVWMIFLKHKDAFDFSLHKEKFSEMKTRNLVTFGCVGLKMSIGEPSRKTE